MKLDTEEALLLQERIDAFTTDMRKLISENLREESANTIIIVPFAGGDEALRAFLDGLDDILDATQHTLFEASFLASNPFGPVGKRFIYATFTDYAGHDMHATVYEVAPAAMHKEDWQPEDILKKTALPIHLFNAHYGATLSVAVEE